MSVSIIWLYTWSVLCSELQPQCLLQLGLNHFADHSRDEYRQMLGYRADLAPERQLQSSTFRYAKSRPPPSKDWREEGAVTDVKNQEQVRTPFCLASVIKMLAGSLAASNAFMSCFTRCVDAWNHLYVYTLFC